MVTSEERADLLAKGEQEYDEAVYQIEQQQYDLAFQHFALAEQTFLQLQDQHWLTFLYHEKFRIYRQIKKLDEALALSDAIINGYLDTNNKHGLALIHIHKADVLGDQGEAEQALACLRAAEAIVVHEKVNDLKGYLYSSLAIALKELGDYLSAIEALQTALQIYHTDINPSEIAWCLHQTGLCYQKLLDFDSAERYLTGAYQSYFKAGDNEAGREVVEQLKHLYLTSNQSGKLAKLDTIGKQKRF